MWKRGWLTINIIIIVIAVLINSSSSSSSTMHRHHGYFHNWIICIWKTVIKKQKPTHGEWYYFRPLVGNHKCLTHPFVTVLYIHWGHPLRSPNHFLSQWIILISWLFGGQIKGSYILVLDSTASELHIKNTDGHSTTKLNFVPEVGQPVYAPTRSSRYSFVCNLCLRLPETC